MVLNYILEEKRAKHFLCVHGGTWTCKRMSYSFLVAAIKDKSRVQTFCLDGLLTVVVELVQSWNLTFAYIVFNICFLFLG